MAQKVLVMGESGTGKSTSMRNCDAAITAVVNQVGKPLPFKNHFDMLNNETDARKITKYMKEQAAAGKKIIVVANLKPAKLRGVESQGMILAADAPEGVKVIFVDGIPSGCTIR